MVGFGCSAVKFVLWIVNFIIFLGGLAILAFGIWIYVNPSSFLFAIQSLPVNNYQLEAWTQSHVLREGMFIIMGIGGFLVILGFLGCCGASRENRCFLLLYGIVMLAVALALAIATGVIFGFKDQLVGEAKEAMDKVLIEEYQYSPVLNQTNIATNTLNLVMIKLRCCGVNNYSDFRTKVKNWPSNVVVPAACCKLQDTSDSSVLPQDANCMASPNDDNSYIRTGCYDRIVTLLKENSIIVIGAMVGIIVLLLLASTLSFLLFNAINRRHRRPKRSVLAASSSSSGGSYRRHGGPRISNRQSYVIPNQHSHHRGLQQTDSCQQPVVISINVHPDTFAQRSFYN